MPKRKREKAREDRISAEIVVDAYGPEERAMGWYYYLEEKLAFPFKARCAFTRTTSPLKKGEEVEVLALAGEDDCQREVFVLIQFADRKLGIPLSQLAVVKAKPETRQAVEDWGYWAAVGYEFWLC
jgi:hypothetical protein